MCNWSQLQWSHYNAMSQSKALSIKNLSQAPSLWNGLQIEIANEIFITCQKHKAGQSFVTHRCTQLPRHLVRVTCIPKRFIGIFMSLVDDFVFFFLGQYTYGTDDLICLFCVCLVSPDILYDLQCTFNKVQCIKDVQLHRYRTETYPRPCSWPKHNIYTYRTRTFDTNVTRYGQQL
jgi:hypothetical protein